MGSPHNDRRLRLPAALIRVWVEAEHRAALEEAREEGQWRPGVAWPRPELCAITPVAADPAVFDAALALSRELLARTGNHLRMVILPGEVEVAGGQVMTPQQDLLDDFDRSPPASALGEVLLTSWAGACLEIPRRMRKHQSYRGPSGASAPLVEALEEDPRAPVYRNPSVLRRSLAYTSRPEIDGALLRRDALVWVQGLPGSGKSRSVWQATHTDAGLLWLRARPVRHLHPRLAAQLLYRLLRMGARAEDLPGLEAMGIDPGRLGTEFGDLLSPATSPAALGDHEALASLLPEWLGNLARRMGGPMTVVVDDLEAAGTTDLALAHSLFELAVTQPSSLRALALSRSGMTWPDSWPAARTLEMPPLTAAQSNSFARAAFAGLELPEGVRERLLDTAAGNPFCLEEAVAGLIHAELIRQVYGNFFFGGGEDTTYLPSKRLILHTEAETRRLGSSELLRLLAIGQIAVPAESLRQTAESSVLIRDDWVESHLGAGWLRTAQTAWGPGVQLANPAFGLALGMTLPEDAAGHWRQELAQVLEKASSQHSWQRYQLLAGSDQAATALLDAVSDPLTPPEALTGALSEELRRLRHQGEHAEFEKEILWKLLPRLHQLGQLGGARNELTRALELSTDQPRRQLAYASLKVDLEEQEGRLDEAEQTIRRALGAVGRGKHPKAEAMLVVRLGRLMLRQSRYDEARTLLEQVAPLLEKGGAVLLTASCHFYLANVALHQDRLEDARRLHERALAARRRHAKPREVGTSLSALGRVAMRQGRYPQAIAHYQEAEHIFSSAGELRDLSFALLGLGKAWSRIGDDVAATGPLTEALRLREQVGDPAGVALSRLALAENHLQLQRHEQARGEARRAYFDLQMLPGQASARAEAEQLLGIIFLRLRQTEKAVRQLESAMGSHRTLRMAEEEVMDHAWLLETALLGTEETEIRRRIDRLEARLDPDLYLERREIVDHILYRAHRWLASQDHGQDRSLPYLRRAYRDLLVKVAHLDPAQRHCFLHQIPAHRALVTDATQQGLSWPEIPLEAAEI